jgi:ketosteroid isomerase-like protein
MSENLDLVRSILEAWEHGDFSSGDWADPDIDYVIADGPAPGHWKSPAGMAEGARANVETWEGLSFEVEEYRELDRERVLVLHNYRGRGKTSGVDLGRVRARGAQLFNVRDRSVTRLVHYWDRQRALADLGLAE